MKSIPQTVSESTKRRNPHLYQSMYSHPGFCGVEVAEAIKSGKPPKRIRQSTKPLMNKLEGEWFAYLKTKYPSHAQYIYPQSVRFKLGNGIWYKPDLWCPILGTWGTCWEIKGPHAFRGGLENLKVAASQYPNLCWMLIWKEHGDWKEQLVLP